MLHAVIRVSDHHFVDEEGRTLLLRGVNVSGTSKVPARPDGGTWRREGFFQHRDVSFVGRPFPLEEADEHFARLREWGLTFVRFLVTWEAIEHAGPDIYDTAYLNYVRAVLEKAAEHGIDVLIDPHQDVWSRFSGGDGAPGWTFEVVGLDITKFQETGAAIVHATHGDPLPRMIWPTNQGKLANLTMWTLFFGSEDFAPSVTVDGVSAQAYLQDHYIGAVKEVAKRVRDLPNVVGFDTLNEPSAGLIGMDDLRARAGLLAKGPSPTALQAMVLGAGLPQEVGVWTVGLRGERRIGTRTLNPNGVSAWLEGHAPVWREAGVWDLGGRRRPRLLRPDHFAKVRGRWIDFHRDYLCPFANRFALAIREAMPEAIIFIEGAPRRGHVPWAPEEDYDGEDDDANDADAPNVVHAPHWYDYFTLFTKRYRPWVTVDTYTRRPVIGRRRVRRAFRRQLARVKRAAREHMNHVPTLIGEVGIPFDLRKRRAYRTGDFSAQVAAMDASLQALDANLLSYTLWNYTPDNTNARGDQWNDEDFSIFSRDQRRDPEHGAQDLYDGGRALEAVVRPYARKIAGNPLHMAFEIESRRFEFDFEHDDAITAPTALFIPRYQYPDGCRITVSDGRFELDADAQTLRYWHTTAQPAHHIVVEPA